MMSKQIISIGYNDLKYSILEEIRQRLSNTTTGLSLHIPQFSMRFVNCTLQKLIDSSFSKMVFNSRSWRNIDPIIFETVMDNGHFLNINNTAYTNNLKYFETEKVYFWTSCIPEKTNKQMLEDEFLAELVEQFPYIVFGPEIEAFVEITIDHLIDNYIFNWFTNMHDSDLLFNQFADSYVEIFVNKLQQGYIVVVNKTMKEYIMLVAQKEAELSPYRQSNQQDNKPAWNMQFFPQQMNFT